jgi:hypothetical protein
MITFERAPEFVAVSVNDKPYGRISRFWKGYQFHQAGVTVDPFSPVSSADLRTIADKIDEINIESKADPVAATDLSEYRGMPCVALHASN